MLSIMFIIDVDYMYIFLEIPPILHMCLTIGHFICCLTFHYSGTESPDIRKRRKLDFKGNGIYHKKKSIEEYEYGIPRKDNKR